MHHIKLSDNTTNSMNEDQNFVYHNNMIILTKIAGMKDEEVIAHLA